MVKARFWLDGKKEWDLVIIKFGWSSIAFLNKFV
jgi:hypothetical protein